MMKIVPYTGLAAQSYISDLARLRIQVFRDFPYLYEGTMEYEEKYLEKFLHASDSILVIAFDGNQVVGVSTGMPMVQAEPPVQSPWIEAGYDVQKIFYFGESVLLKAYRGQGAGVAFFIHRENWARELGRFDKLTFCAVERSINHPSKPAGYTPLDSFWLKRGFEKTEDLFCHLTWKDAGEDRESMKPLRFWVKQCE